MKKNRFIIIGFGNIGQILLKSLSRDYNLLCIDKDDTVLETAKSIREDIDLLVGDATSRLVLEEADVNNADGIIITTTNEKVNIEIARILHESFEPKRCIAIGITDDGLEKLDSYGVEVVNIFMASAVGIINRLKRKTKTTHDIGVGKNEILEVEVHPNSRLANKPLGALAPLKWRIGIIYRDDNIIIPRKDTILKPKDRVVILGEPGVLNTVSEILTFNFQRFPLEYGTMVLVYLTGSEGEEFFDELGYIISSFPVEKTFFVCSKKVTEKKDEIERLCELRNIKGPQFKESSLPILNAISETTKEIKDEQALMIISKKAVLESYKVSIFSSKKRDFLYSLVDICSCPVFMLSHTYPYENTLLPCLVETNIQRIVETGIEIAALINSKITALIVEPSRYIASDSEINTFREIKKRISELGLIHKTSINITTERGNPIKVVQNAVNTHNLLIINKGTHRGGVLSFLNPDVVWNIIKDSTITTVITPPVEETL